jgi:hypothetical protein
MSGTCEVFHYGLCEQPHFGVQQSEQTFTNQKGIESKV